MIGGQSDNAAKRIVADDTKWVPKALQRRDRCRR